MTDQLRAELQVLTIVEVHAITTAESYEAAADGLREIVRRKKLIEEKLGKLIKAASDHHRSLVALRKECEQPLDDADRRLRHEMLLWEDRQAAIRSAQEAALRKAAEVVDEERRIAEAVALEAEGRSAEAALVLDEPAAPMLIVPAPVKRPAGIATRVAYSARVTDLLALVKAVAAGKVPIQAIEPNTSFLNAQARSFKGQLGWPGVTVEGQKVLVAR